MAHIRSLLCRGTMRQAQHFSTSKEDYIDILDMDLIHLVRSYSKCLGMGYDKVPDVISRSLCHIVDSVEIIKRQLDE